MLGAYVSIVKLKKWFPPDDPLAVKVARLCILREDLMLEMHGLHANTIPELDGLSAKSRQMYFQRNLFRTHMELAGGIHRVCTDAEFKKLLEKTSEAMRTKFQTTRAKLEKVRPLLKEVRDDIGAHVQESAVKAALERIDGDSFDLLEIGPAAAFTHYHFAAGLTAAILLKDVSQQERLGSERLGTPSGKYARLAEVLPVFALIECCFGIYARERGLLPLHKF